MESGQRTSYGNSDCIESSVRDSLKIGKCNPIIPVVLKNAWSSVWVILTQRPLVDGGMTRECLKYRRSNPSKGASQVGISVEHERHDSRFQHQPTSDVHPSDLF